MISRDTAEYNEAKYRVKISHFTEQGFDINGVVHAGACDGYEVQWYQKMGMEVLTFEPLPSAYATLGESYPTVQHENVALSDHNGQSTFYVTYGDGAGSSIHQMLDESLVVQEWEDNKVVTGKIEVPVSRFDTWAKEHDFQADKFDCLVMDVQGHELKALHGFGSYLRNFKYLNIECSEVPVYEDEAPAAHVVAFLEKQGFIQDSPIEPHNDVMFIRADIKAESNRTYRGLA